MVPDDLRLPAARRGKLVDVECRRVRRENGVGACHRGELGERGLLQVHVLEHRLHDDVDVTEAVIAHRRSNERECAFHRLRRHSALRHRRRVVLADDRHATVERGLIHVLEQNRNAGIRVRHGDAAAHGAGANDSSTRDRTRGRVFWHARNPAGLALREEHVPHRFRLDRQDAVGEQLDFASRAAVEVHGEAGLDGVHRGEGCPRTPGRLVERRAYCLAGRDACGAIADLVLQIPGAAALLRRGTRAREGDGALQQIAVDHGVDDARLRSPGGSDRLALGAHLERCRRPAQARQPLCAARARDDPEVHLGLSHVRAGDGHAVVTGHGELEAASERVTVNGGNERLVGVFQPVQQRVHRL